MRIIRIIIGIPVMLAGGYLALVAFLIGCVTTQQDIANGSILAGVLWLQGMPTSIDQLVVGVLGGVLVFSGFAIVPRDRRA